MPNPQRAQVFIGEISDGKVGMLADMLRPVFAAAEWRWVLPGGQYRVPSRIDIENMIDGLRQDAQAEGFGSAGGITVVKEGNRELLYVDPRLRPETERERRESAD